MRTLGIDIETYSSYDLAECGVYRYVESPDFAILLFAYAVDNGPVQIVDLASGEEIPSIILRALSDPGVTKTAFNASFERTCLGRMLGKRLIPGQWKCTMVACARMGLPLSLGACAEVLNIPQQKMKEGRDLIRYFSKPGRAGVRHLPGDAPEKWETFKEYCKKDVEVEQALLSIVGRLEVPVFDDHLYWADQEINDRGVLIDRKLVENAARFDDEYKVELLDEAKRVTGLENPNSPSQIKTYIRLQTGRSVPSLDKKVLSDLEDTFRCYPRVKRLLEIRKELGKTSNKKYAAMLKCVCDDGRIHGLLQFYGASRTGRWAGRLVQIQNLPQNHLTDLDLARNLVKAGDLDEFSMNYANVTQVLSELVRTSFVAKDGHTLHVCDFSAIEARVVAWLAGEEWVLDVFRRGGDIYCATASQMFGVPVEKHGPNAELRQKGKISVLALGYGGGVAALEAMGGARMGLTLPEMQNTIKLWREANPRIVKFWSVIEKASFGAIRSKGSIEILRGIRVEYRWGCLLIRLPSGRYLCYPRAKIAKEDGDGWRGDHDIIEYEGLNQTTKKWEKLRTYGGKLTENIVQAVARDILGEVILRTRKAGLEIVFHVHDEIVVEAPPERTLKEIEDIFSSPIDWCRGLPLKGAGYSTPYYLKD